MTDWPLLAAQVGSLRATVGALQAQIDAIARVVEAGLMGSEAPLSPPPCTHEDADFIGTLGAPRRRCRACRAEFVTADDTAAAARLA